MAWFNFLKAEGYFSPDKNPEPVAVKDGFQIPYWEALGYLEKLSLQIKEGKEVELTDEVLSIVKNVSEHPKDNYRTWYSFIKILANLPNEKIPADIFHFMPVWFTGRFDTMLQTSEVCDKLLPKFLNDNPTKGDIEKTELILHYLFQVEKAEINEEEIWDGEGNSYRSRVYLHFLSDAFKKKGLTPKVIKHCSDTFLLELASTIKKLLLDYPKGINSLIKDGEQEYEIKTLIVEKNLLVSSKLKDSEVANATSTLSNFEDLTESELKQQFVIILKQQGINYTPVKDPSDTFERLYFALNNDLISAFGMNAISKLGDRYHNDEKVLHVFAYIFRELLDEKAEQQPQQTLSLLNTFCYKKEYRIPFYKRMTLYVIGEHWDETKVFFWDLVKDEDALHLFSKYKYQKELYELLDKNQQKLLDNEKEILQSIIDKGEQDEVNKETEKHLEYWQLRWYSALRNTEPFSKKYLQLSKELKIDNEHYENLGEVRIRSGSISPITTDDLLQKSNQEISELLLSFQPKDRWEEPNISGLSDALGRAVESDPQKFADEIALYKEVAYIYSYRMLNAFGEAWKKEKSFDWEKVLSYCLTYIKDERFYSGQFQIKNDGWGASPDWVIGSIANLLTDGMQNDKNAFSLDLLPKAKEIILILGSNLKRVEDFKGTNMDYPTYSLNSTAGKVLRALLDYSLRRARNSFKYEDKGKWEIEMQNLFEETLSKEILDGHILEGMYFEQFYFLDKDWITEQVKKHYDIGERQWLAFISGYSFGNAFCSKDIYNLFYPHFDKAIENHVELKSFHNHGLVRHLTAFYFWGFETIADEKLLWKFLNKANPGEVEELVNFVWQQENYKKELTETQQHQFNQIILTLWNYIADRFENPTNEDEQKVLSSLSHLIVFAPELNDTYTQLLLKSCKYAGKNYRTHELIENLVELKKRGNPLVAAKSIAQIINAIEFKEYIAEFDKEHIIELVEFLFKHEQRKEAIAFCNSMAVNRQLFLKEIYDEYNLRTPQ
jgi:hypothetical protein